MAGRLTSSSQGRRTEHPHSSFLRQAKTTGASLPALCSCWRKMVSNWSRRTSTVRGSCRRRRPTLRLASGSLTRSTRSWSCAAASASSITRLRTRAMGRTSERTIPSCSTSATPDRLQEPLRACNPSRRSATTRHGLDAQLPVRVQQQRLAQVSRACSSPLPL